MTFRAKIFLTALAAAALAVLVATALVSWSVRRSLEQRIERELGLEARMAAEILSHHAAADATPSSTARPMRSAGSSAPASPSSPPTAASSATPT